MTPDEKRAPEKRPSKQFSADYHAGPVYTLSFAHFAHDLNGAYLAPLLPLLRAKLSTTLAAVGLLTVFMELPWLLTPVFGYLYDRIRGRLVVALTPAASAAAIGLLGVSDTYALMALLLLCAGASSMAFHLPSVRMLQECAGRRLGLAMSIYTAAGELARALGPLLVVWAVGIWGLPGSWRLIGIGLGTSAFLAWRLRVDEDAFGSGGGERASASIAEVWRALRHLMLPLCGTIFFHILLYDIYYVYLASLVDEVGYSLELAGAAQSARAAAGFFGAFAGGIWSDRFGRRRTIVVALALAAAGTVAMALLIEGGAIALILPALLLAGFMLSVCNPVVMAVVVEYEPRYAATATGIYMLLALVTRMIVTVAAGAIGDQWGLPTTFALAGALTPLGIFFALRLPGPRTRGAPAKRG